MFCAGRGRRDAGHPAQSWETRPSKVLAQPRTQHCPRTAKAKEKGSGDKLSLKKCCSPQSRSSLVFPERSQLPFVALLLGKRAFKGNPTFCIHNLCPRQPCVMSQALFSAPGTVTEPFLSSCSPADLSPSTGTCCSSSPQTWFTHSCWQPAAEGWQASAAQNQAFHGV